MQEDDEIQDIEVDIGECNDGDFIILKFRDDLSSHEFVIDRELAIQVALDILKIANNLSFDDYCK